jgi:beta-1,2-mannobiose phosphorylase / 1,2-beta-oligomannan phosphorylase
MVFSSQRLGFLALMIASVLFLYGTAHGDGNPLRTDFVGNSVTDTIRYGNLAKLAKSRGHTLTWGRDMVPGAPLSWLWEHPKEGFQEEPFGLYPKAFSEHTWDVLSLQPFDRHLDGKDGDLAMARNFIDLALKRSPDVQVYVNSRGPRKDKAMDGSLVLDYKTKWLRKYTGDWDRTEETKDYFERVVAELRKAYDGKAKPVLVVPVGDVLLELHERMRVGKVPDFTDIAEVYMDAIHFNNVGSYIVGTTFYATLFRANPKGMTADPYNEKLAPKKDRLIDDNLAAAIQDAVWTVVSKHPLAGVRSAISVQADGQNQPTSKTTAGWAKYAKNPVLGGKLGTCFDVSVLKEDETYRMWFSWRPKKSIALVESKNGTDWSDPLIVIGPNEQSGWEDDLNRPVVIKNGSSYQMWYTGQARGKSWIGYATSKDGKAWRRESGSPVLSADQSWEKVAVMCPHVINEGGLYRMWYSGGEQYEPNAIGYATSKDGLKWRKHENNPVFKPDPSLAWEKDRVTACQVIQRDGDYLTFYIGFRDQDHAQIGVARSRDGITDWQRHAANPIIRPGREKWDHDAVYKPYAIFDGRRWLLWYNGRRGGMEQIGLATHDGEDLGF